MTSPVTHFPPGHALVNIFVNGVPSPSSILLITPATTTIILSNPTILGNGSFQFSFTSTPGADFTALAATNASLPLNNWATLGAATEVSPGRYQFIDPEAPNTPGRFYRVRSP